MSTINEEDERNARLFLLYFIIFLNFKVENLIFVDVRGSHIYPTTVKSITLSAYSPVTLTTVRNAPIDRPDRLLTRPNTVFALFTDPISTPVRTPTPALPLT